jgi:eukaryotic-like serine/threonine-protein kinase
MVATNESRHLPSNFVVRDTYTVIRYLGSGAFGDVYQVRHRYMGIQAMKVLPNVRTEDPFAEAFILTKVGHPNIIRVFEAHEFAWQGATFPYFTMEYLAGGTLADYVGQNVPNHTVRAKMCLEIASGLAIAHSQNPPIVHRDLSPWNIMVAIDQGRPTVKITDFGLAKSVDLTTRLASAAGNYFYMPPEAFWGHESTASDVFSAALVMFEVLTGQPAYPLSVPSNATEEERMRLVRSSRQKKPVSASGVNRSLITAWDNFFDDALAHDAAKRIQTGSELENRLKSVLSTPENEKDSEPTDLEGMVEEALRSSKQAVSLPQAIKLMEKACNCSEVIRREYAPLLELWKRGIVQ